MANADSSREEHKEQDFSLIQKVADLSPNIFFVVDLRENQLLFISKKVKELFGYDAEDFLDQGLDVFKSILHPDDYERRIKSLEKCRDLFDAEECEVEVRLRTKGNQWKWYKIRERIFKQNDENQVSQVLGIAENIHDRKTREAKLREEHRRLEDAQRIGHIGSFERKLPGEIMLGSEEFFNILGIESRPEGITIEEFYSYVHPEDHAPLLDSVNRAHTTGQPVDTITRIVRPDKSIRHIHRRAALIMDEEGTALRVYGTIQDITERVKADEERVRAEKLMRSTESLAGMGSYELDLTTQTLYFSDGLFRIFGEEPGSFTPSIEWLDQRSHHDDIFEVDNLINEALANNSIYAYTRRIYRKDGTMRTLEANGRLLIDGQGEIRKLIGLVQDVTERKQAEEAIRRNEKRSRNLLEVLQNAPDAYLVLTTDFHIELASDAFLSATETKREEIIGKYIFDAFPDNPQVPDATGVENLRASLNKVLSSKKAHRMSIQNYDVRGQDGSFIEKYWSPTNTPVINSEGEVEYIIHRVLDITEVVAEKDAVKGLVSETEMLKTSLEEVKLQARQLKENRTLLQSIFDASPNSIILYKTLFGKYGEPEDFEFLMVNAFNYLTLDLPRDIIGKKFSEVIQGKNSGQVLEILKNTARTGDSGDCEIWYEGNGLQNWFHIRAVKLDNLLLATAQDISERKQTEETVQQMLNGSISAITILDAVRNEQGEIIDFLFKGANKAAEHINRLPHEQLIGKTMLELFPGVKGALLEDYAQVVNTGSPFRAQRFYRQENFENWFDVSAVKNGDGLIMTFLDITDQKKAEEELVELKEELTKKATDKYRKIINSMDEGFCLIEIIRDGKGDCIDYRYLETNPVFEDQTGLKDVIGKTMNELVPDLETYWKEIYGNVARTGESTRFEDYAEAMGRWFDVNAFRIDSPNEQHVAIIFKDITERKEAEERKTFLLKLNNALRRLEDPAKIQETAMRILGKHLEVNRAYYSQMLKDEDTLSQRLGYINDVDPISGESKISEFSPELLKQFREGKTLVLEDILKQYEHDEEAAAKIDASQVRAVIAVPLLEHGKLVAIVAVQQRDPRKWNEQEIALVEEVCEQTWEAMEKARSEKALRESEQRFRNLVEASALAVWEAEPDGSILKDSISWRNFTGQTYKEWSGLGWLDSVHIEDRDYTFSQWRNALATNKKFDVEYRLLSASGESRWTSVKATPIFNIDGVVTKWAGMNIDIHDRKQAEEALLEAKEEAEAASRAKEDFLSTMSHEIRTPLNAVIGITNLLLDKNPREDQVEDLGSLSFSAKNLLALINNILDFSKLEAGKAELHITDFDFPLLLVNLKQAHQPQANESRTKIILHIDDKIPDRIATDQLKLSQVLHNLVSNAVKFTSDGEVHISVNLERQEQEKYWLHFEVRDTGIGISEEKLEHIFEKFTQAESSTVRQYGGTGLGLSITRLLLELLGSEIKLESTPGAGSRFYFSLPVEKARFASVPATVEAKPETIKNLSNLKILLVEDVEINRKIIIQFLQNWWQMKPDEAQNGKEAIELALKNSYDLILMDIRMPVMDGYEATQRIRTIPGYEDTPILALTADKNQEVQQADNEKRFSGLLTKPFEPLDLKKKILHHLPVSIGETEEPEEDLGKNASEDATVLNSEDQKEFMDLVLVQLKDYRKSFLRAIEEEDKEELKDLQHKSKVLFQVLKLDKLANKLSEVSNLPEPKEQEKRMSVLQEVENLFDETIERVQKETPEPVFDVSRYTAIAGENKEIFKKLIDNSIRTLEIYREEFDAAASKRDQHHLANLVHKNTTTLHYLQANRLGGKIKEFRSLLENTDVTKNELQEKQQEVLLEFSTIISGLEKLDQ